MTYLQHKTSQILQEQFGNVSRSASVIDRVSIDSITIRSFQKLELRQSPEKALWTFEVKRVRNLRHRQFQGCSAQADWQKHKQKVNECQELMAVAWNLYRRLKWKSVFALMKYKPSLKHPACQTPTCHDKSLSSVQDSVSKSYIDLGGPPEARHNKPSRRPLGARRSISASQVPSVFKRDLIWKQVKIRGAEGSCSGPSILFVHRSSLGLRAPVVSPYNPTEPDIFSVLDSNSIEVDALFSLQQTCCSCSPVNCVTSERCLWIPFLMRKGFGVGNITCGSVLDWPITRIVKFVCTYLGTCMQCCHSGIIY